MSDHDNHGYPTLSPWITGFRGRCPRCGDGKLYDGFLKVAERCNVCGLDFSGEDAGDGAVPFIILIVGAIGVAAGALPMLAFDLPVWSAIVIAVPVVVVLVLILLPKTKGLLIALQYVNSAGDTGHGTFSDDDEPPTSAP